MPQVMYNPCRRKLYKKTHHVVTKSIQADISRNYTKYIKDRKLYKLYERPIT